MGHVESEMKLRFACGAGERGRLSRCGQTHLRIPQPGTLASFDIGSQVG
jgi:hypothetical protein